MNKIKQILKSDSGMAYIPTIITVLIVIMLIGLLIIFVSVIVQCDTVKSAFKSSISIAAKTNLDKQYNVFIEGSTYKNNDSSYEEYKNSFYKSLKYNFKNASELVSNNGEKYIVYSDSDKPSYTVDNVIIKISTEDRKMPDGLQKRLIYTVTGTLVIPVNAFGYSGKITIPIKDSASYQLTD